MRRLFAWCLVLSMLLVLPVSLAEQAPEKVFRTLYRSEVSTLNYLTAGRTGDKIETFCKIKHAKPPFFFATGEARVGDKVCATAEFSFAVTGE